jgi:hypothetical protein
METKEYSIKLINNLLIISPKWNPSHTCECGKAYNAKADVYLDLSDEEKELLIKTLSK